MNGNNIRPQPMNKILLLASLFLVACGKPIAMDDFKEKKYTITIHNGNGFAFDSWRTNNRPIPEGGGWCIVLDNGEIVTISGTVIIKRNK